MAQRAQIGEAVVRVRVDMGEVQKALETLQGRAREEARITAADQNVTPQPVGWETHSVGGAEEAERTRYQHRTGAPMGAPPEPVMVGRPEAPVPAPPPDVVRREEAPLAVRAQVIAGQAGRVAVQAPRMAIAPLAGAAIGAARFGRAGLEAGRAFAVGAIPAGIGVAAQAFRPGPAARAVVGAAAIAAAVELAVRGFLPNLIGFVEGLLAGRMGFFSQLAEAMRQRITQIENMLAGPFGHALHTIQQERRMQLIGAEVRQAGPYALAVTQAWQTERMIKEMFEGPLQTTRAAIMAQATRRAALQIFAPWATMGR